MKTTATFAFLLVFLTASHADADAMLSAPAEVRKCDHYIEYCLYSDPSTNQTFVYSFAGDFEKTEIYKIDSWLRNPHLADGGKYVVAGYDGLNLIPRDYSPDMVILTIYENGKLLRQIKLNEIYKTLSSLQETVSHYDWGVILEITYWSTIRLETHEGIVSVSIPNGEITFGE